MRIKLAGLCLMVSALPAAAQLTTEQRVQDFQQLTSLYARYYAPAQWKAVALGRNIFDVAPYIQRVRAAKSDLEYLEICGEWVISLRDGHSEFDVNSDFQIYLGFDVDLYDGKYLIDFVDRRAYPVARFPFTTGDELVSIDGRPAAALAKDLNRLVGLANDRGDARWAGYLLTFRPQAYFPRAPEMPEQSTVVIRRAETGAEESYQLRWSRFGTPLLNLVPVPGYSAAASVYRAPSTAVNRAREPRSLMPARIPLPRPNRPEMDSVEASPDTSGLVGFGSRTPYYSRPDGFTRRRGVGADQLYTGVYQSGGFRLGLIRIPTFSQSTVQRNALLAELSGEIAFMRQNTDGLVVDVSRNPGGWCSASMVARLTNRPVRIYQTQYRPNLAEIRDYQESFTFADDLGAEQWVLDSFTYNLDALTAAAQTPGAMTGGLPACEVPELTTIGRFGFWGLADVYPVVQGTDGRPAGYDKPIIVLQDELSMSQAEHFTAMIQDNQIAPVVGVRSAGLGGFILSFDAGRYSEGSASVTGGLTERRTVARAPGLPPAPYIENIGVIPDVALDSMTRENLLSGYKQFVDGFTKILVDRIQAARAAAPPTN
ncbi:MAG: S41 family peptidase [Acidobacteria bacterium]|nr:S41 family peptidase [Acidobacteriota bacterium]